MVADGFVDSDARCYTQQLESLGVARILWMPEYLNYTIDKLIHTFSSHFVNSHFLHVKIRMWSPLPL